MPHAGLARNTTASFLALTPDIVHPAALHFLQLTPTCIQMVGLYLASQKSRYSHTDFGETLPRYSGQVTKMLALIPVSPSSSI